MIGIYKIENNINHQIYIGQSIDIERRWKQHRRVYLQPQATDYNTKLHQAFRNFGIENFTFSIIEECKIDNLNEREKYWIQYYDSFTNGYNSTRGGKGSSLIDYSQIITLWNEGKSRKEITNILNCTNSVNIKSILETNTDNYNIEAKKRGLEYSKRNQHHIYIYDSDGNFIRECNNRTEAINYTNSSIKSIEKCCAGTSISSNNYQFQYYKQDKILSISQRTQLRQILSKNRYGIKQLDINNTIINKYLTISEAGTVNKYDISSLAKACKSHKKAYNYYWEYLNLEETLMLLAEREPNELLRSTILSAKGKDWRTL